MSNSTNLATAGSSGTQSSTQTPQTSVQASSLGGQNSSLQPGTDSSLLTSSNGINLSDITSNGTTSASTTTASSQVASTEPVHHKVNPVLLGFAIILFVVAIVLFAITSRSEKSTTNK